MRSLTHTFPLITRKFGPRLMQAMVIFSLCSWTTVCLGANYLEEEKFDRAAGILDREWRINLIRMATRDYLRLRSQVKTGLPNYDQLVENTRLAPAMLYDQLTARPGDQSSPPPRVTSMPPEAIRTMPAVSPSAMPGNQQPSGSQQAPAAAQGPPSPPTNVSITPPPPTFPLPDLNPPTVSLPPGAPTPTLPPPSSPGPSVIP